MPTGVYDRKKAAPRGSRKLKQYIGPSENIARLIAMQEELQERINAEKAKELALHKLLAFARNHNLSAKDLRVAANTLADRHVADEPVTSKHKAKATRAGKGHPPVNPVAGVGKVIRDARMALGLSASQVSEKIGRSHSMVGKIEHGTAGITDATASKLAKVLKLPIEQLKPVQANGHAPAH